MLCKVKLRHPPNTNLVTLILSSLTYLNHTQIALCAVPLKYPGGRLPAGFTKPQVCGTLMLSLLKPFLIE